MPKAPPAPAPTPGTLTPERLHQLLRWDAAAKVFRWKTAVGRANVGSVAGTYAGSHKRIGIDGVQYSMARVKELYGLLTNGDSSTDPIAPAVIAEADRPIKRNDPPHVIQMKQRVQHWTTALDTVKRKHAVVLQKAELARKDIASVQARYNEAVTALDQWSAQQDRMQQSIRSAAVRNAANNDD